MSLEHTERLTPPVFSFSFSVGTVQKAAAEHLMREINRAGKSVVLSFYGFVLASK